MADQMASLFSMALVLVSLKLLAPAKAGAGGIESAQLLDRTIRGYSIQSYKNDSRAGITHAVNLPTSLSGIDVDTVKFRCGSLRRYGAKVKEFKMGPGLDLRPCSQSVLIVAQRLGSNWSSVYSNSYDLSGYKLISPVLGLLAYDVDNGDSNIIELQITQGGRKITVDFSSTASSLGSDVGSVPICASFEGDGTVRFERQWKQGACGVTRLGHFGVVVEEAAMGREDVSKGKEVMVISIGGALSVALMGFLLAAMCVNVKKSMMMDEMERRAYEEEALQVTMVGHVRAPTAQIHWGKNIQVDKIENMIWYYTATYERRKEMYTSFHFCDENTIFKINQHRTLEVKYATTRRIGQSWHFRGLGSKAHLGW